MVNRGLTLLRLRQSSALPTRRHPWISSSCVLVVVIMLVVFSMAFDVRLTFTVARAATPSLSRIIRTKSASGEKLYQFHKPAPTLIITARRRFHRHLLVVSTRDCCTQSSNRSTHNSDPPAMRALVGSSPPKCVKKCGGCTPCKSVLVPIHTTNLPATPTEYYPEAWRCQCRGKIYNP